MTLDIQQEEYLEGLSELGGAMVVISAQQIMPFPEHEALFVTPGSFAAVSLKQVGE